MSGPVQPPLTVETIDGATVGRPITKIKVTNGTLAVSGSTATLTISGGGGGSGTVTSIATTAPLTGGTITTTGTIGIPVATGAADGYLSSANFNTFDAKQDAITLTTTGTSGAATFAGGTLNIPQYSGTTGTVTGTGVANQVSYWTAASVQAGSTGLTYNPSTGDLTVGGYVEVGTKVTTPTGTDLTLDTVGGTNSGSIVIADGVDGQVSISANGAGAIKLGAASNPVTVSNVYTLPTAVTTDNNYVLTAQTDGSTAWAASGGGGSGIGGSITDNQVAVGATTSDEIEGSSSFTYDSSTRSLNIAAGTGTGTILSGSSDMVIRNSSATAHSKITLSYNAANSNIKLDTDGSGLVEIHKEGTLAYSLPNVVTTVNDYVLTAQTDGSTAWAASGGGGSGIGGSISDNQIAVGATTADEIEGSSSLTFDASTGRLVVAERISSSGTGSLTLETNNGISSGKIQILNGGVPNHIVITPASGTLNLDAENIRLSQAGNTTITTAGAYDLTLNTNDGTNSGSIAITDGVDGNITLAPNGTGAVVFRSPRVSSFDTPASASAAGVTGSLAYDENYIYVCTATDTWKRVALSTW